MVDNSPTFKIYTAEGGDMKFINLPGFGLATTVWQMF